MQQHIALDNGSSWNTRPTPQPSILAKSSRLEEGGPGTFQSTESRQRRILEIYLCERRYIIKASGYIVSSAQCQPSRNGSEQARNSAVDRLGWVKEIGSVILADWNVDGVSPKGSRNQIVSAVDALQARVTGLEQGSGWFKDQDPSEDIEAVFANGQILEIVHILEIVLILLDSSSKITRSDAFLSWFRFMRKYSFFEYFEPVSQDGESTGESY